ncbi:MAG TPA: PaaI family thioesterase [Candidatus Acidoferrum sp.]|jgi:uncharacterized protein (TIGR00369 family)|nr:PaaI family thioesterase [Candidatus Acidoferrum sp.]
MTQTHFETLVAMYNSAPINKWFRPQLSIPEEGRAEIEMPVREDFYHAARAIHGAVYFKALDDATFFAVQSVVKDFFVVTSSFQLYFLRPVSEGHLLARGQVVSRSKRLYMAEGVLFDSRGEEVARGSGSFMPSSIQLGPELGYR